MSESARSITSHGGEWPTWGEIARTLTLADYNTRIVVIGAALLGLAAGVVGTFAYLRKRAMVGDALSHATLPGIAAAFLLTSSKSLAPLLIGAAVTGALGILCVLGLRRMPRIKDDAAIGIVLSVFFGAGMVLMALTQSMETGNQAGLDRFIYGKAAGMIFDDALLIGGVALAALVGAALLFKEFRIVCFDAEFAAAQGRSVALIDILMMTLIVITTVVGLQAVGLILVVALLIIPAAAARFWTDDLLRMTAMAGFFGALSGWVGSSFSALLPRMPTGALIVLAAGVIFFFSMFFAPLRGVVAAVYRREALARKVAYQNLIRALGEAEERDGEGASLSFHELLAARSWTSRKLRALLRRGRRLGEITTHADGRTSLTPTGRTKANRVLRNHRLWELYLIRYADIAPSQVDRDADRVEHVLSQQIVLELERALAEERRIPPSPHAGEARA